MVENFIADFHFLRPWYLLLLLLPALFYWRFFQTMHNVSSWEKVCDKKLLNFLLVRGSSSSRKLFGRLFLIGLTFAIIAAAGPSWQKKPVPTLTPENPVMILLNLSSDMKNTDIKPSRLERAKFKIIDLLNGLKSAQSGLIVYSQEPFLISPITDDKNIIINLLPAVNYDIMPVNGDRLDRAIDLAVEKLKTAGYAKGNIILFSADVGERFDKALEATKTAAQKNYAVSVLETSAQTNEKLKLIARYGNGIYQNMRSSDEDILALESFIDKNISDLKQSQNEQSVWEDAGYYLVFVPLICCLFFFRRGIFVLVPALLFAPQAYAGWFINNNQEGLQAFEQGDFQTAKQKFEVPEWKAAANYRLGNFTEAAKIYAGKNDETSLYNLGNALAKSGKIEDAIKKYEEVLKLNPKHEDAKFNLEYLKKQQQQQQQNQNNNQQQNNQQQQDDRQQNPSQGQDNQSQNDAGANNQNQENPQGQQNPNDDASSSQPQNQGNEGQADVQPEGSDNQPIENQASSGTEQNDVSPQPAPEDSAQPQEGGLAQSGDQQEKYDEKRQAKVQQLRQISEDPGGLLKAFIAKEYRLNRYQEE